MLFRYSRAFPSGILREKGDVSFGSPWSFVSRSPIKNRLFSVKKGKKTYLMFQELGKLLSSSSAPER